MVRPLSNVWIHFVEYRETNKKRAKCKYCGKKYLVPNATKMAKHLEACRKKPVVVSVPVFSNTDSEESVIVRTEEMIIDSEQGTSIISSVPTTDDDFSNVSTADNISVSMSDVTEITSSSKPSKTPLLRSFFDSMSKNESDKLESLFAKAVYSSNMPLSITDNHHWQQFFKQIRPSFKPPNRNLLSNRLLDKEFDEVMQYNQEKIKKAEFVTIVSDGWSNIRNEGIISYIVTTPQPFFFKSMESKDHRHTAQYISQELKKVIKEIGAEKVTGIVTDNASNMKAAWLLVQAEFPHILTLGCAAHGFNLLLGDLYKIATFQSIISSAKDVIKFVKNKQALLAVFTSKQKARKGSAASTLKLPAETRWCSTLIMFESLLNGKESLQESVLVPELNIERNIRHLVLDNDLFWMSIQSLVNLIRPICVAIKLLESDAATLSDVPNAFIKVRESLDFIIASTPLQTAEEVEVKNLIEKRCKKICQPIHYAAYILDPRYFDQNLGNTEQMSGVDFISNFPINESSSIIMAEFAQYRAKDSMFNNDTVWDSAKLITPRVWWKGFFKGRVLCSLAMRLFAIPPSSAACERIFSAFADTHSLKRNRLCNERVAKLVSIRSHLLLQSKEEAITFESD